MSKLYGIDVYSGEGSDITKKVEYDFAIVKATGNPQAYAWNYINKNAKAQIDAAYKRTGLVGLYHFTWGKPDPTMEVDLFIKEVKELGYLGKAILVIDYEAEAVRRGRTWVAKFAKQIKDKTGCVPVIYASGSVIQNQSLGKLGYPIWEASYPSSKQIKGYNPPSGKVWYKDRVMWQFTERGKLSGYGGEMDLNVFYGDKKKWKKMAKPQSKPKKESIYPTVTLVIGDKGAQVKKLQKCLNKVLKNKLKVDGSFGPRTRDAVKKFQKKYGLKVDGKVGPKTRAEIKKRIK